MCHKMGVNTARTLYFTVRKPSGCDDTVEAGTGTAMAVLCCTVRDSLQAPSESVTPQTS